MDFALKKALGSELIWFPEKGWGYCPTNGFEYDDDYFDHYAELESGEISKALNKVRANLVKRYMSGFVLDMGIGSGAFIKYRGGDTLGFDVNPKGIAWLKERKLFMDPYQEPGESIEAITFWDVLEHFPDAEPILSRIKRWAFVSMPIYQDVEHLLGSKHFKKNEHCLYFTTSGLISWMKEHGFVCMEHNTDEVKCGREDIGSFVFRRS